MNSAAKPTFVASFYGSELGLKAFGAVFGRGREECQADCPAHSAKRSREWCVWFDVGGKETLAAILLFVASLHERTCRELVHRCIPFVKPKRAVLPRLDIPWKTAERRGRRRKRSNNRFPPLYPARRVRDDTKLGIPKQHPKHTRPPPRPMRGTCRRGSDRSPWETLFASSWYFE